MEVSEKRYAHVAKILTPDGTGEEKELARKVVQFLHKYNLEFGIWTEAVKYFTFNRIIELYPLLIKDALSGNGILTNKKVPKEKDIEIIYQNLITKLKEHGLK